VHNYIIVFRPKFERVWAKYVFQQFARIEYPLDIVCCPFHFGWFPPTATKKEFLIWKEREIYEDKKVVILTNVAMKTPIILSGHNYNMPIMKRILHYTDMHVTTCGRVDSANKQQAFIGRDATT
jgi:hypothetical protein